MNWTTKFEQFSRVKHWRDWRDVAADADRWMMEADEFIKFVHSSRIRLTSCLDLHTFCPGSHPKVGCPFAMRTSDSDYICAKSKNTFSFSTGRRGDNTLAKTS